MRYILYVREDWGWEKLTDLDATDHADAFNKALSTLRPGDRIKPIALQPESGLTTRIIDPQDCDMWGGGG